jgi:hypothetical protein
MSTPPKIADTSAETFALASGGAIVALAIPKRSRNSVAIAPSLSPAFALPWNTRTAGIDVFSPETSSATSRDLPTP